MIEKSIQETQERRVLVFAVVAALIGVAAGVAVASSADGLGLILAIVAIFVLVLTIYRVEWGLLALIFVTYTRFSDVAISYHGAPSLTKFYMVFVFLALVVNWIWLGKRPSSGWQRPLILLIIFGLYGLTSILYSADPLRSQEAAISYLKDAIIALLVVLLITNGQTFRHVVWVLIVAGGFMAGLSVMQYFSGTFTNEYWGFAQAPVMHIVGETNDHRVAGPIGDPNFYAQIVLTIVPLAMDRMWHEKRATLRVVAVIAFVLCLLAVAFTFSRGGFIVLILVMVAMLVLHPPRPTTMAAIIAGAAILVAVAPGQFFSRIGTLTDLLPGSRQGVLFEPSFRGRASELMVGWRMFSDHPVLGVGASNYPVHYQSYSQRLGLDPRTEEREPHNLYFEFASERGLIGLALFSFILWAVYRGLIQSWKSLREAGRNDLSHLVLAFLVSLSGYLLASMFIHNAYSRYLWLLVGIAFSLPQVARYETGDLNV